MYTLGNNSNYSNNLYIFQTKFDFDEIAFKCTNFVLVFMKIYEQQSKINIHHLAKFKHFEF